MSDHCPDHANNMACMAVYAKDIALIQKDIEYMRRGQDDILARFAKHIAEAERDGGYHDRIKAAEGEIIAQREALATFRKFQLLYSALGGIVGGLVGSGAPSLIPSILKHWGIG